MLQNRQKTDSSTRTKEMNVTSNHGYHLCPQPLENVLVSTDTCPTEVVREDGTVAAPLFNHHHQAQQLCTSVPSPDGQSPPPFTSRDHIGSETLEGTGQGGISVAHEPSKPSPWPPRSLAFLPLPRSNTNAHRLTLLLSFCLYTRVYTVGLTSNL